MPSPFDSIADCHTVHQNEDAQSIVAVRCTQVGKSSERVVVTTIPGLAENWKKSMVWQ